jgi:hypothetical protein
MIAPKIMVIMLWKMIIQLMIAKLSYFSLITQIFKN